MQAPKMFADAEHRYREACVKLQRVLEAWEPRAVWTEEYGKFHQDSPLDCRPAIQVLEKFKDSIDLLREKVLLLGLQGPTVRAAYGEQNAKALVSEMDNRIDLSNTSGLVHLDFRCLKIFAAMRSPQVLTLIKDLIQLQRTTNDHIPRPNLLNGDWLARARFFADQLHRAKGGRRDMVRRKLKQFLQLNLYQQTRDTLSQDSEYQSYFMISNNCSLSFTDIINECTKGKK